MKQSYFSSHSETPIDGGGTTGSHLQSGALPVSQELLITRRSSPSTFWEWFGLFFLLASAITLSKVTLYLAQRSFKMLLAFVGYHQAPDRFKRTLDINLLELSMPPLPMW